MTLSQSKTDKKLTGKHVLISVIAFFTVLILVNGTFIFYAINSFRGEDVKGSYRQGLNYNSVINDRREQAALGWNAFVEVVPNGAESSGENKKTIAVQIKNASGRKISVADIQGRLRHPIDTSLDIPLTFTGNAPSVATVTIPAGRWTLEGEAVQNSDHFKFRKSLLIK